MRALNKKIPKLHISASFCVPLNCKSVGAFMFKLSGFALQPLGQDDSSCFLPRASRSDHVHPGAEILWENTNYCKCHYEAARGSEPGRCTSLSVRGK